MTGRLAALLVLGLSGCARGQSADAASDLAQYVIREIPDTAHRHFIDFGGKLELVAYEMSPDGKAGPGQSVNAKLYWKPVSAISPGWALFTHLEDESGRQLRNLDEAGPLRKWLSAKAPNALSLLELGTTYLDEQTFEMPKADELSPEALLVVGVWNGDMRLPVVSGSSDGHHGGVVAHIDTGLEWPKKAARAGQEVRR